MPISRQVRITRSAISPRLATRTRVTLANRHQHIVGRHDRPLFGKDLTHGPGDPGDDAVLHWMRGTGLRPVLSELDEAEQVEFLEEYGARLRAAYPPRDYGTVLPYRRIFVVAQIAPSQ